MNIHGCIFKRHLPARQHPDGTRQRRDHMTSLWARMVLQIDLLFEIIENEDTKLAEVLPQPHIQEIITLCSQIINTVIKQVYLSRFSAERRIQLSSWKQVRVTRQFSAAKCKIYCIFLFGMGQYSLQIPKNRITMSDSLSMYWLVNHLQGTEEKREGQLSNNVKYVKCITIRSNLCELFRSPQ